MIDLFSLINLSEENEQLEDSINTLSTYNIGMIEAARRMNQYPGLIRSSKRVKSTNKPRKNPKEDSNDNEDKEN